MTMLQPTIRPATIAGPFRSMAVTEARWYLRRPVIWIGLAVSVILGVAAAHAEDNWSGEAYMWAVPISILPFVLATFITSVCSGGRDRHRGESVIAGEAPVAEGDRALARIVGLLVPIGLAALATIVVAVNARIEGGFWIGEGVRSTNAAQHSLLELLQPPLMVAVTGTFGVAIGRATLRAAPPIIVGALVWFLGSAGWWLWNTPGVHAGALMQTQPLFVDMPAGMTDVSSPADWFVNPPNEFGDGWRRMVVHLPTVAWHHVFLMGLVALSAGVAVRGRRGRGIGLVGGVLALAGVVAQLVAAPAGLF